MPIDPELLTAIYRGNVSLAREVLARGAAPNQVESDGYNALFYAIISDNPPAVRSALVGLLIKAGADVNHSESGQGWTALAFAARSNCVEVCQLLLAAGARVDPVDSFGNTPLWRATFSKHAAVVALLVKAGANPDLKSKSGMSARMLAEERGNAYFVAGS